MSELRPMTTSQWRRLALEAEKGCAWLEAAHCWKMARAVYPEHHPKSQLAKADCDALEARYKSCVRSAQEEMAREFEDVPIALDYDNDCAPD